MTSEGLAASSVRMRFGGVTALRDASISVERGRIEGLIGRNGSGKSTLFNCMTGFLKPTAGRISLGTRDLTGLPPARIVEAGVVRTFQTPRVDLKSTVKEAVLCGFYAAVRTGYLGALLGLPRAWAEERELHDRADAVLDRLGLLGFRHTEIGKLSMGRVRLVEVARGLAAGSRFILLDEPAAGLAQDEQELLAEQVRAVAASGVGVLLVEHNFDLIHSVCHHVTVLDGGQVLCTGTPDEVARDERVLNAYLGAAGDVGIREAAQ